MKPLLTTLLLGSLAGCSDPAGGGEKFVERYANGQQKSEGYRLDDGTKVGHWIEWCENGHKMIEGNFEDGSKKEEGEYQNDEKEGPWIYWNEDRSIDDYFSGIYEDGEKISPLPDK